MLTSICFSHIVLYHFISKEDNRLPSSQLPASYPVLAHTDTSVDVSQADVRVYIRSAQTSCTPGESTGRWCWFRSKYARAMRGGGLGKAPTALSFKLLLNLHIPVHSSEGMPHYVRDDCIKGVTE